MKIQPRNIKRFIATTAATLVLASCASAPTTPDGAAAARARLTQLQGNTELASRAPIEIRDAAVAVAAAEVGQRDSALAQHLVLMADHKVEIASNWAQSRLYEDQRAELNRQAELARLESRTQEAERARYEAELARREADSARDAAASARTQTQSALSAADAARIEAEAARSQTASARSDASVARSAADAARSQAEIARDEAAAARLDAGVARDQTAAALREAEELQRRLVELDARSTDRGMVVTLGDVLFETGRSELKGGTTGNLDSLADFLNQYADRTVLIEGHTDSVGTESSNVSLSQRRADAVSDYLISRNVSASRISASGKGEGMPVADNDSVTGRQQNRRVEVIISNIDESPR